MSIYIAHRRRKTSNAQNEDMFIRQALRLRLSGIKI